MKKSLTILIIALFTALAASSQILVVISPESSAKTQKPKKEASGERAVRFAWGADFGGSIDMTGHDMSSFTFHGAAGISCPYLEFAGVGVGTDIAVSNSSRSYPIFAEFRTGFHKTPRLLFGDLRMGCSINYLPGDLHQTGLYISVGPGIHLATSNKFSSYIQLAYTLLDRHDIHPADGGADIFVPRIHYATVRLGVTF